jgi:hypothetical protein
MVKGHVMTWEVEAEFNGTWDVEDSFATRAEARKYIANARFWDAISRRIVRVSDGSEVVAE